MTVLNKYHGNIPTDAVYIGRGSEWGNPFVIGKHGTREFVIEEYRKLLWQKIEADPNFKHKLAKLHGKDLVCFCAPKPCHGHVLERAAAWANNTLQGEVE